jgi:hypothetical protein
MFSKILNTPLSLIASGQLQVLTQLLPNFFVDQGSHDV